MIKLIDLLEIRIDKPTPKWKWKLNITGEEIERIPEVINHKINSNENILITKYFQELDGPDFQPNYNNITIKQAVEEIDSGSMVIENIGHIVKAIWPEVNIEY